MFKIDTKEKFSIIDLYLTSNAESLSVYIDNLLKSEKLENNNIIIVLQDDFLLVDSEIDSILAFIKSHYEKNASLVFYLKNTENYLKYSSIFLENSCTLTQTLDEAIDIVSMEQMERDLLSEWDEEID